MDGTNENRLSTRTKPRGRLLVAAGVVVVALAVCSTAAALRVAGTLVPRSGTLMGAYVNPSNQHDMTLGQQEKLVRNFESLIGRKLDIDLNYYGWGVAFWRRMPAWDLNGGRIPLVKYGAHGIPPLDAINDGSEDPTIRALADGARSLGQPFFFCPMWEMNGRWSSWNGSRNNDPGTLDGPIKFVKAWRHMHDIFVQEGATNAIWVWEPSRLDLPNEDWNHWLKYYPGDAYVDWVGVDGYNYGTANAGWTSKWSSFEQLFTPLYDDFDGRKPIMIAETGTVGAGGDKGQWMMDARDVIKARYRDVSALVWFESDKEENWNVDSTARSLAYYRDWVHDPYFDPNANLTTPSGQSLPVVTGRPQVGRALTGTDGTWTNSPTSFSLAWKRCSTTGGACVAIPGATTPTYVPTSNDVGRTLRLFVTATNGSGSGEVASDPTGIVASVAPFAPKDVLSPSVNGTLEVGQTVESWRGSWQGAPWTYTFQWYRCDRTGAGCAALPGATSPTRSLLPGDAGYRMQLRVTAVNGSGSATAGTATQMVYASAPTSTSPPTIAGAPVLGGTLTADPGTWSHSRGLWYQWRRCDAFGYCTDIADANSSSYVVTLADVGSTIRVDAIGSNYWGSTLAESDPTLPAS